MKTLKMYICNCGHKWIIPITAGGIYLKIWNWFKIKRCPMCKEIVFDTYKCTLSSGPR